MHVLLFAIAIFGFGAAKVKPTWRVRQTSAALADRRRPLLRFMSALLSEHTLAWLDDLPGHLAMMRAAKSLH
jgi:hypothetical protein